MKKLFILFKETFQEWKQDNASQLAAALAYYSIFSLAPLILLLIFLAGFFLEGKEAQKQIFSFFQNNVSTESAQTVQSMIRAVQPQQGNLWSKIMGFAVLILGATGVLTQLQFAFNKIWNVQLSPEAGFKMSLKKRFLSFSLILLIGILILLSLLLSTGLTLVLKFLKGVFPWANYALPLAELTISFGILSLLFMLMFKYLPDVKLSWKHVWRGAVLTGFLFMVGKFALAWYFTAGNVGSTYGVASSFIILLLWIYYSSLILLFGAEFTKVWVKKKGFNIQPSKMAVYKKERIVIKRPSFLQKLKIVVAVLKTEVKLAHFFLKLKKAFTKKKSKTNHPKE